MVETIATLVALLVTFSSVDEKSECEKGCRCKRAPPHISTNGQTDPPSRPLLSWRSRGDVQEEDTERGLG